MTLGNGNRWWTTACYPGSIPLPLDPYSRCGWKSMPSHVLSKTKKPCFENLNSHRPFTFIFTTCLLAPNIWSHLIKNGQSPRRIANDELFSLAIHVTSNNHLQLRWLLQLFWGENWLGIWVAHSHSDGGFIWNLISLLTEGPVSHSIPTCHQQLARESFGDLLSLTAGGKH